MANENTDLVVSEPRQMVRTLNDVHGVALAVANSGLYDKIKHKTEAFVKILYACELGLGPISSLSSIHVVEGTPTLGANIIAGRIKQHHRYDYRVKKLDAQGCTLEFFENGESLGELAWDQTDVKRANLQNKNNWKNYPRSMFFARAMTEGARVYCPDILHGAPIYTAEEINPEIEVTASGDAAPGSVPPPTDTGSGDVLDAEWSEGGEETSKDPEGPDDSPPNEDPKTPEGQMGLKIVDDPEPEPEEGLSEPQRAVLNRMMQKGNKTLAQFDQYLAEVGLKSIDDLKPAHFNALVDWLS